MYASDWRLELWPRARKTAVQRIMRAVMQYKHLDDEDGMQELEKFSQCFEQKTFAGARSQSDYFQKITSKEVSIKRKMQEEAYQKIVMLKEMYLPELKEIYENIVNKIQQLDSCTLQAELKRAKNNFQRLIAVLQFSEGKMQEEAYQKIVMLKEMCLPELEEIYQNIVNKILQLESRTQQAESYRCEKLKRAKAEFEHDIEILQVSKSDISPALSRKLPVCQERISNNIYAYRKRFPTNDTGSTSSSSSSSTNAVILN